MLNANIILPQQSCVASFLLLRVPNALMQGLPEQYLYEALPCAFVTAGACHAAVVEVTAVSSGVPTILTALLGNGITDDSNKPCRCMWPM